MTPGCTASPEPTAALSTPRPTVQPTLCPLYSEADALAAAESYRDIYEAAYNGETFSFDLLKEDANRIAARLAASGDAAYCPGMVPLTAPSCAEQFYADTQSGKDRTVSIYEICQDGGFLCHTLGFTDGQYIVTRTRLAWQDGGEYALQGTVPTVTYSDTYQVTGLSMDGTMLYYEYYMPDNPAGGSHDGHIDTTISIPLY